MQGSRGKPAGLNRNDSSLMFIQITPPHGWKQDSDNHYLRLTLPGFAAKEVSIHLDKYGHLVVRGDRQVSEHKYVSFEETFDVPKDADIEEADGGFQDDQIYCIAIPKKKRNSVSSKGGIKLHDSIPMPEDQQVNTKLPKKDINIYKPEVDGIISDNTYPKTPMQFGSTKDHLNIVKGNTPRRKRFALSAAVLSAIIIAVVVLIVVLHRRGHK